MSISRQIIIPPPGTPVLAAGVRTNNSSLSLSRVPCWILHTHFRKPCSPKFKKTVRECAAACVSAADSSGRVSVGRCSPARSTGRARPRVACLPAWLPWLASSSSRKPEIPELTPFPPPFNHPPSVACPFFLLFYFLIHFFYSFRRGSLI